MFNVAYAAFAHRDKRHGGQAVQPALLLVLVDLAEARVVARKLWREISHRCHDHRIFVWRMSAGNNIRPLVVLVLGALEAL